MQKKRDWECVLKLWSILIINVLTAVQVIAVMDVVRAEFLFVGGNLLEIISVHISL